jgi:O-antigen ligase
MALGRAAFWVPFAGYVLASLIVLSSRSEIGAGVLVVAAAWAALKGNADALGGVLCVTALGAGARIGALPCPLVVVAVAGFGSVCYVLRTDGWTRVAWLRCFGCALVLSVLAWRWIGARPSTREGRFVVYEQLVIFLCIVTLSLLGKDRTHKAPRLSVASIAAIGSVASVSALYLVRHNIVQFEANRQIVSVFGGSNYVAALAAAAAIALFHVVHAHPTGVVRWIIIGLLFATPIVMASRTSTAVMLLLAAVLLIQNRRRRRGFSSAISAGLLVVLASVLGGALLRRLGTTAIASSASDRFFLWRMAWTTALHAPFLGIGPGRLADLYLESGQIAYYAHNLFLSLFAQYGFLVGIVAVLVLLPPRSLTFATPLSAAAVTLGLISLLEPSVDTLRLGLLCVVCTSLSLRERSLSTGSANCIRGESREART